MRLFIIGVLCLFFVSAHAGQFQQDTLVVEETVAFVRPDSVEHTDVPPIPHEIRTVSDTIAPQEGWDKEPERIVVATDQEGTLKGEVFYVKTPKKPHSPHKATLMALALPGSGQIYNGQWWKVPILYGGIGAAMYGLIWNTKTHKKYRSAYVDYYLYLEAVAADPETLYPEDPSWEKVTSRDPRRFTPTQQQQFKQALQNRKDGYRRDRDLLYIVMGGIYALQIIDACVYAHFYDFEIDDNLSLNIRPEAIPSISGGTLGLTLTLNF